MDWVGPVYGYLDRVGNLLVDWVGLGDVHGHLDWVGHLLLNGVGLGHMHFDGVGDVFFYWVGLGYQHLYGVGPVDWDLDGDMDDLFHWVGLGYWDLNVDRDLDWVGNLLHYRVGGGYCHLNRVGDVSGDGVGNVLLHWVWDRHALDHRDGFLCVRAYERKQVLLLGNSLGCQSFRCG